MEDAFGYTELSQKALEQCDAAVERAMAQRGVAELRIGDAQLSLVAMADNPDASDGPRARATILDLLEYYTLPEGHVFHPVDVALMQAKSTLRASPVTGVPLGLPASLNVTTLDVTTFGWDSASLKLAGPWLVGALVDVKTGPRGQDPPPFARYEVMSYCEGLHLLRGSDGPPAWVDFGRMRPTQARRVPPQ